MKALKLKIIYYLMRSLNMRFVAIEMDDTTEQLSIQGNIPMADFDVIMNIVKQIQLKQSKDE